MSLEWAESTVVRCLAMPSKIKVSSPNSVDLVAEINYKKDLHENLQWIALIEDIWHGTLDFFI